MQLMHNHSLRFCFEEMKENNLVILGTQYQINPPCVVGGGVQECWFKYLLGNAYWSVLIDPLPLVGFRQQYSFFVASCSPLCGF